MFRIPSLVLLVHVLGGCGGGGSAPVGVSEPQPPSTPPLLSISALTVELPGDVRMRLAADGALTIGGEAVGTVGADGVFIDASGSPAATLTEKGTILVQDVVQMVRIQEGELVTDAGKKAGFNPASELAFQGTDLEAIRIEGLTEQNRKTALYVVALFLLLSDLGPSA